MAVEGPAAEHERRVREAIGVLAMITSATHAPWPGDAFIDNSKQTGLKAPSLVRLKLFTLDNRFVARRLGTLAGSDREAVSARVRDAIPMFAGSI